MKTRHTFIILFVILVTSSFAGFAESKTRKLPSFSEISLRLPGSVYLEQGNVQNVTIQATESTLEEIITEVNDRTLIIRFKNTNFFGRMFNPGKIEIYITVPEIDALSVAGSGDIKGKTVDARIIDLAVSGSGNISLEQLNTDRIKAAISGSGNIRLNGGKAIELNAAVSGSGNLRAADFETEHADTRISGSGNCSIFAQKSLKARVSGSGSVLYNGNPQIDSAVSGSGRIKKL